jgi:hypothetical protein
MPPGKTPTLLVILATNGAYPKLSMTGKVTRLPAPTTEFIVPAAIPAKTSIDASKRPIAKYGEERVQKFLTAM